MPYISGSHCELECDIYNNCTVTEDGSHSINCESVIQSTVLETPTSTAVLTSDDGDHAPQDTSVSMTSWFTSLSTKLNLSSISSYLYAISDLEMSNSETIFSTILSYLNESFINPTTWTVPTDKINEQTEELFDFHSNSFSYLSPFCEDPNCHGLSNTVTTSDADYSVLPTIHSSFNDHNSLDVEWLPSDPPSYFWISSIEPSFSSILAWLPKNSNSMSEAGHSPYSLSDMGEANDSTFYMTEMYSNEFNSNQQNSSPDVLSLDMDTHDELTFTTVYPNTFQMESTVHSIHLSSSMFNDLDDPPTSYLSNLAITPDATLLVNDSYMDQSMLSSSELNADAELSTILECTVAFQNPTHECTENSYGYTVMNTYEDNEESEPVSSRQLELSLSFPETQSIETSIKSISLSLTAESELIYSVQQTGRPYILVNIH